MRIRFEIQSLAALGVGTHRLPINCWRLTMLYQPSRDGVGQLLDGVSFTVDLRQDQTVPTFHLARVVLGGVLLPDGTPVSLNQVLTVTSDSASRQGLGMLVYEYLEP